MLASCGYDHKVIVWKEVRPNDWEKLKEFDHHKSSGTVLPFEYFRSQRVCLGTLGIRTGAGDRQL